MILGRRGGELTSCHRESKSPGSCGSSGASADLVTAITVTLCGQLLSHTLAIDCGGPPFLRVETDQCRARLTSYGAQLCEWTPAGESPVLSARLILGHEAEIRLQRGLHWHAASGERDEDLVAGVDAIAVLGAHVEPAARWQREDDAVELAQTEFGRDVLSHVREVQGDAGRRRRFRKTAGQLEVALDGPLGPGRVPHLLAEEVDGRAEAARMQRPRERESFVEGLARHVAEGAAARRRRDREPGADQALIGVAGGEAEEEAAT